MGLGDIIERMRERKREKKELIRKMDEQMRAEEMLNERRKSSNERELERFMKEDREESIKLQLERARKIRQEDINFGHNPLNAKNVVSGSDFQVLKQKNIFNGKSNLFSNKQFIHKDNKKLLQNSKWLMK